MGSQDPTFFDKGRELSENNKKVGKPIAAIAVLQSSFCNTTIQCKNDKKIGA